MKVFLLVLVSSLIFSGYSQNGIAGALTSLFSPTPSTTQYPSQYPNTQQSQANSQISSSIAASLAGSSQSSVRYA